MVNAGNNNPILPSVIRLLCIVTSGRLRATTNSEEGTGLGKEQGAFISIQAKKLTSQQSCFGKMLN